MDCTGLSQVNGAKFRFGVRIFFMSGWYATSAGRTRAGASKERSVILYAHPTSDVNILIFRLSGTALGTAFAKARALIQRGSKRPRCASKRHSFQSLISSS